MHLAVDAQQRTVGVNDRGGVVINAGGAFLKERGDDDDLVFFGELAKSVGAGAGNRFGELEIFVVFALAKILRAEQFLGADDLRAALGRAFGERERFFQIRVRVGGTGGLNQPKFDGLGGSAFHLFGAVVEPGGFFEDDGFNVRVLGHDGKRSGRTVRG